jgi:hypothetical protein
VEDKTPLHHEQEPVEEEEEQKCSQGEFNEFTGFLGKCLISLSRMIRKVYSELVQKSQNSSSSFPVEDSCYLVTQTQTCFEGKII